MMKARSVALFAVTCFGAFALGFLGVAGYLVATAEPQANTPIGLEPGNALLVTVERQGEKRIVFRATRDADLCQEIVGDQTESARVNGGPIASDPSASPPIYIVSSHCLMADRSMVIGLDYEKSDRIQRMLDSLGPRENY